MRKLIKYSYNPNKFLRFKLYLRSKRFPVRISIGSEIKLKIQPLKLIENLSWISIMF
jgi:hypothetical protein